MAKKKRKKLKVKAVVILFIVLFIVFGLGGFVFYKIKENIKYNMHETKYIASANLSEKLYNEKGEEALDIIRGNEVVLYPNRILNDLYEVSYDNKTYYAKKDILVDDISLVVLEKNAFVRTTYNLKESNDSTKLLELVKKGTELQIIGFDKLNSDGTVNMYKVQVGDKIGYFYYKYVLPTKEEAMVNYGETFNKKVLTNTKNPYGGGSIATLDYFPVEKPKFEDNVMPDNVYSLYLEGTGEIIKHIDEFIKLAKETKINTFVVDIQDDIASYGTDYMKEVSPSSYKVALTKESAYQEAIKKLKDNGFYVIGRITAFKDSNYVKDHKSAGISYKSSGKLVTKSGSNWPTVYSRDVWEYKVNLAVDAVKTMGFNEIQFDYVRFPDGVSGSDIDFHNTYNETKAEAVQRFLMYACDELHKYNVYVSADVFGESSWGYVTSYGQYWPADSNIVDAISAMPYLDHFGNNYGGYTNPWEHPYETMATWAKTAQARQKETPTPAIARTWVTAYNTPYWNPTVTYNADSVSKQIEALYDNGLKGGYMTWNAYSYSNKLNKYKLQKAAYSKEYK